MPSRSEGQLRSFQAGLPEQHVVRIEGGDREDTDACLGQRIGEGIQDARQAEVEGSLDLQGAPAFFAAGADGHAAFRADNRKLFPSACDRAEGSCGVRPAGHGLSGAKAADGKSAFQELQLEGGFCHEHSPGMFVVGPVIHPRQRAVHWGASMVESFSLRQMDRMLRREMAPARRNRNQPKGPRSAGAKRGA